ncbi:CRISPR-associated endonuclease Cas2 [Acinetobacter sp. c2-A9]|uniref:CRISPR-associated endonuclease Cas2 n=1 Tax=Acinetobacter sp. c2-A9 TaxID=3342802 RepID=UPI0035B9F5B3
MIIVSYDISDDKVRARFAKFLMQYGERLQYSVYEIKNSERILNIVTENIKFEFEKDFTGADSVIIFRFTEREVLRFGHAKHRMQDLLVL